jgi:Zn-dependent protease with chaperone function
MVLTAGVMLAAAGCGTSHDIVIGGAPAAAGPSAAPSTAPAEAGRPAPSTKPTAANAPDVSRTALLRLGSLLLDNRDLPGFSVQRVAASYGQPSMSACPPLARPPTGAAMGAGILLADPATGSAVTEYDFALPGQGAADATLASFAAMPQRCRSFHGAPAAGYSASFTAAPLPLKSVGGPAAAARLTGAVTISGQRGVLYEDVAAMQAGTTVIVLVVFDTRPDTALTQTVADNAYQKAVPGAVAAGATGAAPPQSATLTGYWQDAAGDVVQFAPAGADAWTGQLVRPGGALCGPLGIQVAGAGGRRFTGTMTDYSGSAGHCGAVTGRGAVTIVVEPDGASLAVNQTAADGLPCATCAPATWSRALGPAGGAAPAPRATSTAAATSSSTATAPHSAPQRRPSIAVLLALAVLLVLIAVLVTALVRTPRRAVRRGGGTAAQAVPPVEQDPEAGLDPAERAKRLADRLRRTLLTDPRVLPSATSLRFAALVLMLIASTASVYAFLGLDVARANDPQSLLCMAQAGPPGVGPMSQLSISASVELGCSRHYAADAVGWALAGIVVIVLLTGLVYLVTPYWITRSTRPLRQKPGLEQDMLARIAHLAGTIGTEMPECFIDLSADNTDARAFGTRRHGRVKINGGWLSQFGAAPKHFDAILLHELAHLRNGDVVRAYITFAAWRVFVAAALLPYVVQVLFPALLTHGSLRLDPSWPNPHVPLAVGVLSILLYLSRCAVLRIRETHADAVASLHEPDGMREVIELAIEEQGKRRPTAEEQGERGLAASRVRCLLSRPTLLADHPLPQRRLGDVADPAVLAAVDGPALFGAGVAISLFTVNLEFVLWVAGLSSWASGDLLNRIIDGTAGNGAILLFMLGVWGPTTLLEFAAVAALACAVMWRSHLCAIPGGSRLSAVRAAVPLAVGMMIGQPLSLIYADADTWGVFDVNGAWELADVAASTLALGLLLALIFRWAGECAAVWIPVTRRSLRRVCAVAALACAAGVAPAALVWSILGNSGSMTSLVRVFPGASVSRWFGAGWAYTQYVPLNFVAGRIPAGALLLGLPVGFLTVGALRRTQDARPRWLPAKIVRALPLLRASRPRTRPGAAVTSGLTAAAVSAVLGLAVVLVLRARLGGGATAADLAAGGTAVLAGWLTWITVTVCAVAAALTAYRARDTALSTALLTVFVAGAFATVLLLVPESIALCGGSAPKCAADPDGGQLRALFAGLTAGVPVEAALAAAVLAGAVTALGLLFGRGRARSGQGLRPSLLEAYAAGKVSDVGAGAAQSERGRTRAYAIVAIAISLLIAAVGLWVYLPNLASG